MSGRGSRDREQGRDIRGKDRRIPTKKVWYETYRLNKHTLECSVVSNQKKSMMDGQ